MMQVINPRRYDAFVRLMSLPDPADLPHRGNILRCEGEPNRRSTRLPTILMGWLQRRHLAIDSDVPMASATRSQKRRQRADLRILRPTGTADR